MNPFEVMLKSRVYGLIEDQQGARLLDQLDDEALARSGVELTQICFKVTPALKREIVEKVELLGLSKRRFFELATIYALERVQREIDEAGLADAVDQREVRA